MKRIHKSNFVENVLVSVFWEVEEFSDFELVPWNNIQSNKPVDDMGICFEVSTGNNTV